MQKSSTCKGPGAGRQGPESPQRPRSEGPPAHGRLRTALLCGGRWEPVQTLSRGRPSALLSKTAGAEVLGSGGGGENGGADFGSPLQQSRLETREVCGSGNMGREVMVCFEGKTIRLCYRVDLGQERKRNEGTPKGCGVLRCPQLLPLCSVPAGQPASGGLCTANCFLLGRGPVCQWSGQVSVGIGDRQSQRRLPGRILRICSLC